MSTSTMPWRKNSFDLETPVQNRTEKATIQYFFRLESESSAASADDTESVYSVQDKETDVVRDTSDTASDTSEYRVDVDIEYEIESVSESEDDRDMIIFDSSGDSESMIYAAAMIADSSLETFITDGEDSDTSRQEDSLSGLTDYWICIQCKSQNDHPQYRFCDKCFQDRKAIFPPRPRRRKKAEKKIEKSHTPVKLDALQSCLNGLSSQDSGISSSQEFGSLCLDQIVVPSSEPSTSLTEDEEVKNRKRQFSESSLSDEYEAKRPPKKAKTTKEDKENAEKKKEEKSCEKQDEVKEEKGSDKKDDVVSESARTKDAQIKGPLPELKEDCIMCNVKPKNSVFLHGRIAHMCCCYSCAMRTWKSMKRCPICQRKVSNVVRVFTT